MEKKTLEEIGKILLVSIISILVSVMATRRVLLDSKLDKSIYYRDQELHNERHKREREDLKETKEMVRDIHNYLLKEGG